MKIIGNLLHALTLAGIRLSLTEGGRLKVSGDKNKLTPELKKGVQQHKGTLTTLLTVSAAEKEEADERAAIQFADQPEAAEALADAMEWLDKLIDDMANHNPPAMASVALDTTSHPCRRCSSKVTSLAVIHNGDSLRRDCARCGRFVEFVAWNQPEEVQKMLGQKTTIRYNKGQATQVRQHLSGSNTNTLFEKESG